MLEHISSESSLLSAEWKKGNKIEYSLALTFKQILLTYSWFAKRIELTYNIQTILQWLGNLVL